MSSIHGTAPIEAGQFAEFAAAIIRQLPRDLDSTIAQGWIENQAALQRVLRQALVPVAADAESLIADWQSFYRDFFGQEYDFSQVRIPAKQVGFKRLLIIAQGLTPNLVFETCHFKCWRYTDDLDAATKGRNEREPTDHYAIWVRDRQEADEELKDLSADQIKEKGITTEVLLERLVHEAKFFDETNQHLDIENTTLCSGSRGSHGYVPGASWDDGEFRVDWDGPGDSHGDLRAREVVS